MTGRTPSTEEPDQNGARGTIATYRLVTGVLLPPRPGETGTGRDAPRVPPYPSPPQHSAPRIAGRRAEFFLDAEQLVVLRQPAGSETRANSIVTGTPSIVAYRISPPGVQLLTIAHGAKDWPSDPG